MNDYIYYYLLAVNILAFVLFGVDKQKARRNKWRIPEKTSVSYTHLTLPTIA